MAERPIIRYGDRTTHGGTVVSADSNFSIDGKNVSRVGDLVDCPRCLGTFRIVSGAPNVWSGQNVARHDDVTSCGAKLIASQNTMTIDDGSEASAVYAGAPALLAQSTDDSAAKEEPQAIRFQAVHPTTSQPLPKRPYIVTRENGAQHRGLTDAQGFTEIIETEVPEQVAVHFMFLDASGRIINREDFTP